MFSGRVQKWRSKFNEWNTNYFRSWKNSENRANWISLHVSTVIMQSKLCYGYFIICSYLIIIGRFITRACSLLHVQVNHFTLGWNSTQAENSSIALKIQMGLEISAWANWIVRSEWNFSPGRKENLGMRCDFFSGSKLGLKFVITRQNSNYRYCSSSNHPIFPFRIF